MTFHTLYILLPAIVSLHATMSAITPPVEQKPEMVITFEFQNIDTQTKENILNSMRSRFNADLQGFPIACHIVANSKEITTSDYHQTLSVEVRRVAEQAAIFMRCTQNTKPNLNFERRFSVPYDHVTKALANACLLSLSPIGEITHVDKTGILVEFPYQKQIVQFHSSMRHELLEILDIEMPVFQIQVARAQFIKATPLDRSAIKLLSNVEKGMFVRRIWALPNINVKVENAYGLPAPGVKISLRYQDGTTTSIGKTNAQGRVTYSKLTSGGRFFAEPGCFIAQNDLHNMIQTAIIGQDIETIVRLPSRVGEIIDRQKLDQINDQLFDCSVVVNKLASDFTRAINSKDINKAEITLRQLGSVHGKLLGIKLNSNPNHQELVKKLEARIQQIKGAINIKVAKSSVQQLKINLAIKRVQAALENDHFEKVEKMLSEIAKLHRVGSDGRSMYIYREKLFRNSRLNANSHVKFARKQLATINRANIRILWGTTQKAIGDIIAAGQQKANGETDGDLVGLLQIFHAIPTWRQYITDEANAIAKTINSKSSLSAAERDRYQGQLDKLSKITKNLSSIESIVRAKLHRHPYHASHDR